MAVTSDEDRKQQLLCCLAQSCNPARKFTWGNLVTLRDNIADYDLYKAVHEFRKRHYSAHRMTLAVQVLCTSYVLVTCIIFVCSRTKTERGITSMRVPEYKVTKAAQVRLLLLCR